MDSDLVRGALRALPYTVAAILAYHLLTIRPSSQGADPPVIESPLGSTSALSKEQQDRLPYPPDALPGQRDIDSPYGTIRAYEWGNPDGQKVLLVHGISTPCVSLAGVAKGLVDRGYRVLMFDLFGRGYSATPDTDNNPQTVQLFCSQIHFVLSSSPLSWTGSSTFHLVGYSLGGGISLAFTSYFPELVDSLVLIAPSGLIRQSRMAFPSRLIHANVIPGPVLRAMVRKRFGGGKAVKQANKQSANPEATPGKAMTAEMPKDAHPALAADSRAPLFPDRPSISVADAVAWQVDHNKGFIPAFISSIQHAPITGQHERWRIIGRRLAEQRSNPQNTAAASRGLRHGKVLMVMGRTDEVIVGDEVVPDATEAIGADGVQVSWIDAAHDLPVVKPEEIVQSIVDFWAE